MFIDGILHEYLYQNNKIYFIILDKDGEIEKNLKLCENVESVNFSYSESIITTKIKMGEILYNNNFKLQ